VVGRAASADDLLIVDCLLPGQVRKLGSQMTYLSARRPIQTTAQDCEIRGGEYVAYDRANYATALQVWLPRAQEGDPDAQNKVGEIYEKGMGTHPDYDMAALWYRRAADQGFSRAQVNLGFLYEKGLGVPQDLQTALNWYRKGSKLPDAVVIDHGELAAAQAELVSVKQELGSTRQQLSSLQAQLKSSRTELERARAGLHSRERQLQQQRLRLRKAQEQQVQGSISPEERARIERMRAQVEQQQQALARSRDQIHDLESQSKAQREKLLTLEAQGVSLKDQLALTRSQLDNTRQDLEHYQTLANAGAAQLEQTRAQLSSLQAGGQGGSVERIRKLESQLAQREQALAQERETAQRLQGQASELEQALAVSGKDRVVLEATRKRLLETTKELERSRSLVAEREQELGKTQAELAAKGSQGVTDRRAQELEARLKEREKAFAENQKMVERLRSEANQWKAKLAQLEKQAPTGKTTETRTTAGAAVPLAPPTIQLIEPPLVAVRGATRIPIKRGLEQRSIIGQVSAAAGLYSLTINGAKADADAKGLFKGDIPIAGEETQINIVAVDKQGVRATLAFALVTEADSGEKVARPTNPLAGVDIGGYYALVIGNRNYQYLPRLDTTTKDAEDVAKVLKQRFGFKVKLLLDATRYQILSELNRYRQELTDKDNLLIYYAGHGELDRINMRGQWLPVDAELNSSANWIPNVAITDVLNAMAVRHVLVVADSCYSGALTRSSLANLDAGKSEEQRKFWLQSVAKMRSRTVLTSGGVAPVLDGGGGEHSVFAKALLGVLQELNDVSDGQRVYREVAARVAYDASRYEVEQVPQYAPIKFAGHESGDFLFVPKKLQSRG
jgi:TPR repeat protein